MNTDKSYLSSDSITMDEIFKKDIILSHASSSSVVSSDDEMVNEVIKDHSLNIAHDKNEPQNHTNSFIYVPINDLETDRKPKIQSNNEKKRARASTGNQKSPKAEPPRRARASTGNQREHRSATDVRDVLQPRERRNSITDLRLKGEVARDELDVIADQHARASIMVTSPTMNARASRASFQQARGSVNSTTPSNYALKYGEDSEKKMPEWKRVLDNIWQKPRYYVHEAHDIEVKAGWTELFYDLLYVAACIELGNKLKENLTPEGYGYCFLYFATFWWTWQMANEYYARFVTDDFSHQYCVFGHMVGVLGMSIHVTPETFKYNEAFAICFIISRFFIIVMLLQVVYFIEKARRSTGLLIISYLVSCSLWIASIWLSDSVSPIFWSVGLVVEMCIALYPYKARHNLDKHNGYTAERQGLFIMLVLGESVISLVLANFASDVDYYLVVFFGFWVVFNLQVNFFDCMPTEEQEHGAYSTIVRSRLVMGLHLVLSFTLLGVGVGLKLAATYSIAPYKFKESYAYLLSVSVCLALFFMQLTRIANQDGFHGEYFFKSWDRRVLFVIRLVIPCIAGALPAMMHQQNSRDLVIYLFALTFVYTSLDTYGHHRYDHQQKMVLLTNQTARDYEYYVANPPPPLATFYDYEPVEVSLWMTNDVKVTEATASLVIEIGVTGEKLLLATAAEILIVFGKEDGSNIILHVARVANGGDMGVGH